MNERLPFEREALEILRRSGCSQSVIRHCRAVAKLAEEIGKIFVEKKIGLNVDLVRIGALLHDIGRSRTHSVDHAVVGSEIARSLGLPCEIVSIIERHIGGGITAEEAEKLGWPNKSYVPQTIEEKTVAYADKLIEGSRRIPIDRTIQHLKKKLGPCHPAVERLEKLHEEISALLGDVT